MVGENIKRLRGQRGMTQDELAERLNVTRQAVSNWERGRTEPDIGTLETLARELEVPMEELIYGHVEKPKSKVVQITSGTAEKGGFIGSALAIVISYVHWHSIGWAILHGLLGWAYVIYYAIKYI